MKLRRSTKKPTSDKTKSLSARYAEVLKLRQALAKSRSPLKRSAINVNNPICK